MAWNELAIYLLSYSILAYLIVLIYGIIEWYWVPNSWYRWNYLEKYPYKIILFQPIFSWLQEREYERRKPEFISDFKERMLAEGGWKSEEEWEIFYRKKMKLIFDKRNNNPGTPEGEAHSRYWADVFTEKEKEERKKRPDNGWRYLYYDKAWYMKNLDQEKRQEVERIISIFKEREKGGNTDLLRRNFTYIVANGAIQFFINEENGFPILDKGLKSRVNRLIKSSHFKDEDINYIKKKLSYELLNRYFEDLIMEKGALLKTTPLLKFKYNDNLKKKITKRVLFEQNVGKLVPLIRLENRKYL